MEQKKVVSIAEKIKAIAITFIGAAFIVYGCIYFIPQTEYYVPRILLPVYNLLGHIGLAIGMLILGGSLVYYGFRNWRKQESNTLIFVGIAFASILVFVLINMFTGKSSSSTTLEEMEEKRTAQIEDVKQSDRPKLNSKEVEDYFNEFEQLLAKYKEDTKNKNTEAIAKDQEDYNALLMKSASAVNTLSNNDKHTFSVYNAKLMIMWSEVK